MPLSGDAKPRPKAVSLARGTRRFHRKVASARQWQKIASAKMGPCLVCVEPAGNGHGLGVIQLHHIVSRQDGGDDVAENIVPLCQPHHDAVTRRDPNACAVFLKRLGDDEVAYMRAKAGDDYPFRAYGIAMRYKP